VVIINFGDICKTLNRSQVRGPVCPPSPFPHFQSFTTPLQDQTLHLIIAPRNLILSPTHRTTSSAFMLAEMGNTEFA
jgi:hypothetical protein